MISGKEQPWQTAALDALSDPEIDRIVFPSGRTMIVEPKLGRNLQYAPVDEQLAAYHAAFPEIAKTYQSESRMYRSFAVPIIRLTVSVRQMTKQFRRAEQQMRLYQLIMTLDLGCWQTPADLRLLNLLRSRDPRRVKQGIRLAQQRGLWK